MTPEVHAAVERLRSARYSAPAAQYQADLALLVAAADAGAREQASGAAVTGENSSHDHGNCALCEHLDVYWRKQLVTATARVQALEGYAAHKHECAIRLPHLQPQPHPCDCGLVALLQPEAPRAAGGA